MDAAVRDFYASLPVVDDFAEAAEPAAYTPLPNDWFVGVSDIVGSTKAVAAGRYRAVNMVGAGVIASIANALKRKPFPFVFGGDGASFAIGPDDREATVAALAAMATFAREEYDINLRVGLAPITDVRAAGRDVRVSRFGASPHCAYAMFSGGGLRWAETRIKAGEYAITPAPSGARPDLSHLSCRWRVSDSLKGVVLSLVVSPINDDERFSALVSDIVHLTMKETDGGRPVTPPMLTADNPIKSVGLESQARALPGLARVKSFAGSLAAFGVGWIFHTFKLKAGGFDAAVYASDIAANADFRKFDDGLRMTLDCSNEFADRIEARLAGSSDYADWGVYRQSAAQITCYSPAITERGHLHFVDGASGGYTLAAKAMKERAANRPRAAA